MLGTVGFFLQARNTLAAGQFGQHLFGAQAVLSQDDQAMKP